MPTLTIRNVEEETVQRLKKQAKDHNRSLEAELRELLKRAANRMSAAELRANADRIAAMTPKGIKQTDSTLLLREDRDR